MNHRIWRTGTRTQKTSLPKSCEGAGPRLRRTRSKFAVAGFLAAMSLIPAGCRAGQGDVRRVEESELVVPSGAPVRPGNTLEVSIRDRVEAWQGLPTLQLIRTPRDGSLLLAADTEEVYLISEAPTSTPQNSMKSECLRGLRPPVAVGTSNTGHLEVFATGHQSFQPSDNLPLTILPTSPFFLPHAIWISQGFGAILGEYGGLGHRSSRVLEILNRRASHWEKCGTVEIESAWWSADCLQIGAELHFGIVEAALVIGTAHADGSIDTYRLDCKSTCAVRLFDNGGRPAWAFVNSAGRNCLHCDGRTMIFPGVTGGQIDAVSYDGKIAILTESADVGFCLYEGSMEDGFVSHKIEDLGKTYRGYRLVRLEHGLGIAWTDLTKVYMRIVQL